MSSFKENKIRLKYLFNKRVSGSWGNEPYEGNSIVCIRAADFDTDRLVHKTTNLTRRSFQDDEIRNKELQKGDLIIEKSGGGENQPVGRVVRFSLKETALCSNFLEIFRPDKEILNPEFGAFMLYYLWVSRTVTTCIKQTTGIQNLDISSFLNIKVHIPELKIQIELSNYLNKEVAYIDRLVDTKGKFIELLNEKRQALISQAVSKGLIPYIELKDSGFKWLGKFPKHWSLKKIKYLADLRSGEFITSDTIKESDLYPVYGGNGLRGYTSEKTHSGEFVLIGRQGALCGNINYAKGDFWASEHAIVCRPKVIYNIFWFGELLRIMNLNQYSAAAAQPGLSIDIIKNLSIPVPPIEEQEQIVKFINQEIDKIDKLKIATMRSIELLKERRIALIVTTVTCQNKIPLV